MKKTIIVLVIVSVMLGFGVREYTKEQVGYEGPEIVEAETYEFEHGIVGYEFETWSYDGTPLEFEYFIQNKRNTCEFGIVFLINGIPQTYTVNNQETEMYTVDMRESEEEIVNISLAPQVDGDSKICNLNAYVVLNPSTTITDANKYGFNHSVSSTATVLLEMNSKGDSDNVIVDSIDVTYEEISVETRKNYDTDAGNMLDSEIYCQLNDVGNEAFPYLNKDEKVSLSVLGKSGNYCLLQIEDNEIVKVYDVSVKENQRATLALGLEGEEVTNIYFLVVPLDVLENEEYTRLNQSERCIVSGGGLKEIVGEGEIQDKKREVIESVEQKSLVMNDYLLADIATHDDKLILCNCLDTLNFCAIWRN